MTRTLAARPWRGNWKAGTGRITGSCPARRLRYRTEVAGGGDGRLEQLRLRHRDTGDTQTEQADGLFVLIGAQPFTDWLPETVGRDQWGYILTGPDLAERWTLQLGRRSRADGR